jgi:hypothetical protein
VERLNAAQRTEEVVAIANEFIDSWDESERSRLPAGCMPPVLRSVQDLNAYALTLTQVQLEFAGSLARGALLDRMTLFFNYASTRAAQLAYLARVT